MAKFFLTVAVLCSMAVFANAKPKDYAAARKAVLADKEVVLHVGVNQDKAEFFTPSGSLVGVPDGVYQCKLVNGVALMFPVIESTAQVQPTFTVPTLFSIPSFGGCVGGNCFRR